MIKNNNNQNKNTKILPFILWSLIQYNVRQKQKEREAQL
jgi:hypothetical protein